MATIFKLQAVPGSNAARHAAKTMREPGVYEQTDRKGTSYFVRLEDGTLARVTREQAEARAVDYLDPALQTAASLMGPGSVIEHGDRPGRLACSYCSQTFDAADLEAHKASATHLRVAAQEAENTALATLQSAGLDWEVELRPIAFIESAAVATTEDYVGVDFSKALVRADNRRALAVVGKRFTPVQNAQCDMFDKAARDGRLTYTGAWESDDSRKVSLAFRLNGAQIDAMGYHFSAGGEVTNAHDGTSRLAATATVTVDGHTLYAPSGFKFTHTQSIHILRAQASEILGHVVDSARDLMTMARAVVALDPATASAAVLETLDWSSRAKVAIDDSITVKAEKIAAARECALDELCKRAEQLPAELGGLRFVIAAGFWFIRGESPSTYSLRFGTARDRITDALVAAARIAQALRAVYGEELAQVLAGPEETRAKLVADAMRRLDGATSRESDEARADRLLGPDTTGLDA